MLKKTPVVMLILLSLGFHIKSAAQIVYPDTACINNPVAFSAPVNNTYYSWQLNTGTISAAISTVPASINALGGTTTVAASWTTIQHDTDGNWFGFYTHFPDGTVHKLSFGTSPLNTPSDNIIGSFSTNNIIQGLDVVYDPDNHKWYGFVVGGSNLIVLDFGNALSNTPTSVMYNFPGKFGFPHQIGVKKFDKDWIGFIADRNGSIVRLDFTAGLSAQPIATNLPIANYTNPCNFALYQSAGNWYMIVPSLLNNNKIALLNFGSDLKNNAPVSNSIAGQISGIYIPRSLNLFSNCGNNELLLYVINESGGFVKLNFDGQITNNVSSSSLGNFADGGGVMTNFVYDNKVYGLKTSSDGTIGRVALFDLPQGTVTKYMEEGLTGSFTQPGQVPVRLMTDPGLVMGTSSYCGQLSLKDCSTSIGLVTETRNTISQNSPNPANSTTTIRIQLDGKVYKDKKIVLKDPTGKWVSSYHLNDETNLKIDVSPLQSGIYYYSLLIDGQVMETKKMVVVH